MILSSVNYKNGSHSSGDVVLDKWLKKFLEEFAHEIATGKVIEPYRIFKFHASLRLNKKETILFLKQLQEKGIPIFRKNRGYLFLKGGGEPI